MIQSTQAQIMGAGDLARLVAPCGAIRFNFPSRPLASAIEINVRFFAGCLKWGLSALTAMSGFAAAQPVDVPQAQQGAQPATADSAASQSIQTYRFDIAAQPLSEALKQYGAITGRSVFFDGSVVAGRTSTAVQGVYAPEVALRRLVEGTGLTVDYADPSLAEAFVLKAIDPRQPLPLPDAGAPETLRLTRYDGLVQASLWDALCSIPSVAPDDYATAVRFNIDLTGHLIDIRLLHSTGDRQRDEALEVTLQHIQLDEPPPPDTMQPIYMEVLPAQPGQQCPSHR
jgi:hypothetical protein